MHLFLKIISGMTNSVDPDQTAPTGAVWSGSTHFICHFLRNFGVQKFMTWVKGTVYTCFLQRRQLLWFLVCFPARQVPSEKGYILRWKNLVQMGAAFFLLMKTLRGRFTHHDSSLQILCQILYWLYQVKRLGTSMCKICIFRAYTLCWHMATDKRACQVSIFLISPRKHILCYW